MAHVLVAHDSETIRDLVSRLLREAGYQVTSVAEGHEALAALDHRPDALVLDVALPGVFCWEVLGKVKERGLATKSILIASIYNRAGYKRRPTSLYGADDYVEQHHIPDLLLIKLAKLVGGPIPDGKQIDAAVAEETDRIRDASEARLRIRYATRDEGLMRAKRLARLIVADIALYNRDLAFLGEDERQARLREDLEEGRLLFELRVPHELRESHDFVAEALEEWLHEARRGGPRGEGG